MLRNVLQSSSPATSAVSPVSTASPVVLAVIAWLSVTRLRLTCAPSASLVTEVLVQLGLLGLWYWSIGRWSAGRSSTGGPDQGGSRPSLARIFLLVGAMVSIPWANEFLWRLLGQGTGLELVMMSSFGWAALGAALGARRRRSLSTTVICSGFLTLLATCSSDSSIALVFAYAWGALCLWWLASSHWQRVANCQAQAVVESRWYRPLTVVAGCAVFIMAAWSVAGRFPDSQRLGWELMPTSGGTTTHAPYASGGVGDGDAVVAAREHAATFGAVDSDLFLDSEEASLYDMFSDTFGEPVRKQAVERSIALTPREEIASQLEKMAQSDQASSKLTTQRRGNTKTVPMTSQISDAVLFWIGRTNMHLPLRRYGQFDGVNWSANPSSDDHFSSVPLAHTAASDHQLIRESSDKRAWITSRSIVDRTRAEIGPYVGARAEAIKYARLHTRAIPTVAGMYSWQIDQIDDPTMFRLDEHDNLSMPSRLRVPEFTVVRFVNREMEIELIESAATMMVAERKLSAISDAADNADTLQENLLTEWLGRYSGQRVSKWQLCQRVVEQIRTQFQLDRTLDYSESEAPLATFFQKRAGSDLMFATAAAVMLRKLGMQTRLVTGFIARSQNRIGWTEETAIYPQDMHAWIEVELLPGCWVPLEPSPDYPQPSVHVSWRYWLKQQAIMIVSSLSIMVTLGAGLWWQRAFVFDCLCQLCGWWLMFLNDRLRCRWLLRVLDIRSWLVGRPRPAHIPPRRWYGQLLNNAPENIRRALDVLFRDADRLWFGNESQLSQAGRSACQTLWYHSTCKRMQLDAGSHKATP